jgi:uncharacterized protein
MDQVAFSTPAEAPRWKRWLVYSPLARIAIYALLAGTSFFALFTAARLLGWTGRLAPPIPHAIATFALQIVPMLAAYLLLVRVLERRPVTELAWRKVVRDVPVGAAAGVLLITIVVAVLWLSGSYVVSGTNPQVDWWTPLFLAGLGTATAEEIIFRGVLFRIIEEGLGTRAALVFSAVLFGGLHAWNPDATTWSSVAIAVEAGLMLGTAYHVTRSLPLCIGIHTGWNYAQGTLYGVPVSGAGGTGWLVSQRPGPDWLTGGAFGAEASVIAVAVCSLFTLALLAHAWRHRTLFVRRSDRRRIMQAASFPRP